MKLNQLLVAAGLVAPMLTAALPAQAATSNQYRLQGLGLYTSSKGHVYGYQPGYGYPPYGAYRPYGYYRPDGSYPHSRRWHHQGYRPYN